MSYLFLVLFPDGRVKAYRTSELAARCAAADGGEVLTVVLSQLATPAAAAAPAAVEPAAATPAPAAAAPAPDPAPVTVTLSPVPDLVVVKPAAPPPVCSACGQVIVPKQ
jgi:hypothetical protein